MAEIEEILKYAGFVNVPDNLEVPKFAEADVFQWQKCRKIDEALDYYGLSADKAFMEMFQPYYEKASKDEKLLKAVFLLNETLFRAEDFSKVELERPQPDMFAPLVLLSGYQKHLRNMRQRGFDEEQEMFQKNAIYHICTKGIKFYNQNGADLGSLLWGRLFINAHIVRFGRLQYELKKFHYKLENAGVEKGCFCVGVHIPRAGRLDPAAVDESFKAAYRKLKNFFPEIQDKIVFCCNSWLLGTALEEFLPEDSNIRKFRDRFELIQPGKTSSILKFLFDKAQDIVDLRQLPEDTSLRKKIKQKLCQGCQFFDGIGIIKS